MKALKKQTNARLVSVTHIYQMVRQYEIRLSPESIYMVRYSDIKLLLEEGQVELIWLAIGLSSTNFSAEIFLYCIHVYRHLMSYTAAVFQDQKKIPCNYFIPHLIHILILWNHHHKELIENNLRFKWFRFWPPRLVKKFNIFAIDVKIEKLCTIYQAVWAIGLHISFSHFYAVW